MSRSLRYIFGLTVLSFFLVCSIAHAQITLDGSMGTAGPLTGPNFTIPSSVGQTRGGNLFHSFGLFNVLTGESATFTGPNTISNIIGRVTGGQLSTIDGKISSTILGANLYLMNPAGWVFGKNASLDVGGSFHVTTADYLKFADGAQFFASLTKESQLTSAPVAAFGFLGPEPAKAIDVRGPFLIVPTGNSLSFVGGNTGFTDPDTGTTPDGVTITGGTLVAPSGQINLVSVGMPSEPTATKGGEVPISATGAVALSAGFQNMGSLAINNSTISPNTSFPTGKGTVFIQAGKLVMSGGSIAAGNNSQSNSPGDIGINAAQVELNAGATIVSRGALALGQAGGSVTVQGANGPGTSADSLSLKEESSIAVDSQIGVGSIDLHAAAITIDGKSSISGMSPVTPFNLYRSGDIDIATETLQLLNQSSIASNVVGGHPDVNPGPATITVHGIGGPTTRAQTISLEGGSYISADSRMSSRASGNIQLLADTITVPVGTKITADSDTTQGFPNSGNIELTGKAVTIDGGSVSSQNSLFQVFEDVGKIAINAEQISLRNGGTISTRSNSQGDGVSSHIQLNGLSGPDSLAQAISLDGGSTISAETKGGKPGDISLRAINITLNGSTISSKIDGDGLTGSEQLRSAHSHIALTGETVTLSRSTISGELAGSTETASDVTINANHIDLSHSTINSSQTINSTLIFVNGAGGVTLQGMGGPGTLADTIHLDQSSVLSEVLTTTPGTITLAGRGIDLSNSTISANVKGAPNFDPQVFQKSVADINVTGETVNVNGGRISAETNFFTTGGNVNITGTSVSLSQGATVSTKSTGTAQTFPEPPPLGSITLPAGNAGDINLVVSSLEMKNGTITTEAKEAAGGSITITHTGSILNLTNSQITTSVNGGGGKGGNITIGGQLDPLTLKPVNINPFDFIILNNSGIHANAFGGPGGNITIFADNFLKSPDSSITASSALSTPGTIDIQASITNLSGFLEPLPENVVPASSLLKQSCATRYSEGKLSSFVVGSRDGLPLEPGSFMPSPLFRFPDSARASTRPEKTDLASALLASVRPAYSIVAPCGKLR